MQLGITKDKRCALLGTVALMETMSQTSERSPGKRVLRKPLVLHITTLPDKQTTLRLEGSAPSSRQPSPLLPKKQPVTSLRSSPRSSLRAVSPGESEMKRANSTSSLLSVLQQRDKSCVLSAPFEFQKTVEPRSLPQAVESREVRDTLSGELLLIKKRVKHFHRLAVEFNAGIRIRQTRKAQPRLRLLLYR